VAGTSNVSVTLPFGVTVMLPEHSCLQASGQVEKSEVGVQTEVVMDADKAGVDEGEAKEGAKDDKKN